MPPGESGIFLSVDHLAVVVLTLALNAVACLRAREDPAATWIPRFMKGLAAVQLVTAAATQVAFVVEGQWNAAWSLPCQLCDAAIAASILAMFKPTPLAFELTYFWGLGGALQGIITPAIAEGFPHPVFLAFFAVHVGLVTAALFLAFGLRMTPRPGVVLRMMVWTNAVAIVAGITDWLTGGNYMFLRSPPPTGSLLDLLGGWPWYLVAGEIVALLVYGLLSVPFRIRRARESPTWQ